MKFDYPFTLICSNLVIWMEYKKPWKTFIGFNLRVDLASFWNPKNETCKDCRCQNMADKQLGAESRALLFSLLNACKILLVFLLILNYANANSTCTVTQLTIIRGDGTTQCEDCPKCPPGQGLSLKCGSLIPDPETHITCEHCSPGESYSDKDDILQCKECDSCMEGQDVVHPCDERTNVECGKSCSSPNRYFDKKRGCLNCSCCGEGNHTVEEECKRKLGAGSNMICSFNSSAPGCEFTSPLPQADPTRSHVVTTRLVDQSSSDFITPSPQTEITSSHVVTAGLFNQSISSRDFITPSQQTVTTTNQDAATSKPVTSSINHPKKINEPSLIAVVIISFLVLFGIVVATLYFLHPESMQRCWKCRNEAAIDPQMGIELGQNPGERTPMVPKDSKLLSRLLEDEAIENVCDALDTRRKGRRNYENVAKHYCFNIYQIEARLERSPRGPSRELIEWLSAYRPEMTIEEFARVVEGTTKRTSVVDLLREFDNVDETRL